MEYIDYPVALGHEQEAFRKLNMVSKWHKTIVKYVVKIDTNMGHFSALLCKLAKFKKYYTWSTCTSSTVFDHVLSMRCRT
jgi:hypothetical protein